MARLPGLELRPASGQAPSTATVGATDLGLLGAAQDLQGWSREREQTRAMEAEKQRGDDEKAVRPRLEAIELAWGREFAEGQARYDGKTPGFAQGVIGRFDAHATPELEKGDLTPGQQAALRAGVDRMRVRAGQSAIDAEARLAGNAVAAQEATRKAAVVTGALGGYMTRFGELTAPINQAFDGSQGDHVAQVLAAHDTAAKEILEAAPEAERPTLQLKLDAERLDVQARADTEARSGALAFAASKAKAAGDAMSNAVISNPNLIDTADRLLDEAVEGLPADKRGAARVEMRGKLATARVRGLVDQGHTDVALSELKSGRWDAWVSPEGKASLIEGVKAAAAGRARDALEAFHWQGDVDLGEAARQAQVAGDPGLEAQVQWRTLVGDAEPGELNRLAAEGGGAEGFASAVNFTIEREGGDATIENDNGRGVSRFGINQAANPDLDVRNINRAQAVARYRKYWQAVKADSLPPDLALAAFDAAVLHGPDDANRWLAQSGGDVSKFLALQQGYMRQLAKQDPGKYGDDLKGWLNRVELVRKEAARIRAFVGVKEGVTSDPIKFALGDKTRAALAQVPPVPESPTDAGFGAALQGRLTVGRMMNTRYRAPMRLLTNSEAAFYKDAIERDPGQGVALATASLKAIGPANTRALLAELGMQGGGAAALHVADLAASGLTPFADKATRGLTLGDKAKVDPEVMKSFQATVEDYRGLMPDAETWVVVQSVAEAAMRADAQTGKPRPPSYYLNSALGASVRGGKVFGGVVEVNGRRTLIPSWLGADHADDVMDWLGSSFETLSARGAKQLPKADGMRAQPNVEVWDRPVLRNGDGSYSTASSISIGTDKGEVVIPTVVGGKRLSQEQAIQHFRKTGQHLGIFDTPAHAEAYARQLHSAQEAYVDNREANWPVWSSGQPLKARDISRLRLQLMPSGRYRFFTARGEAIQGRRGGAFEIDLDKAAPRLRQRLGPGAVAEGW